MICSGSTPKASPYLLPSCQLQQDLPGASSELVEWFPLQTPTHKHLPYLHHTSFPFYAQLNAVALCFCCSLSLQSLLISMICFGCRFLPEIIRNSQNTGTKNVRVVCSGIVLLTHSTQPQTSAAVCTVFECAAVAVATIVTLFL